MEAAGKILNGEKANKLYLPDTSVGKHEEHFFPLSPSPQG